MKHENQNMPCRGIGSLPRVSHNCWMVEDKFIDILVHPLCGARDKAVSVVPVVGPSVDCSLSHFGVEL